MVHNVRNADYCGMLPKEYVNLDKMPFGTALKPYTCCNCIDPIDRKAKRAANRIAKKPVPTAQRMDAPYLQHLQRICTIKKVIDNEHPTVILNLLLKTDVVKNDLHRYEEINAQNKMLLCRIDEIRRSKGVVDSYNPNAGIRCTNLLHTHRWISRIEKENVEMHKRIKSVKPEIKNSDLLRCWKHNKETIVNGSRYAMILPGICPSTSLLSSDCMDQYRPKAFLDIAVRDGRMLGRIVVLLYPDIVPKTARNFMELVHNYKRDQKALLRHEQNMAKKPRKPRKEFTHYVGSPVYKIYQKLYIEMGDMTKENGMGGRSATGKDFPQENFILEANYPGMLAMIPDTDGLVNSKFLITVKPLKVMNGTRVIFGRIIKGIDTVDLIEKLSRPNGLPKEPIIISNCGLLPPRKFLRDVVTSVN